MTTSIQTIFNKVFKRILDSLGMHPNLSFYLSVVLLLILVPICLLVSLHPITKDSTGPVWVDFWGSFLGGLIGAVITYVVMNRTFNENNKNNETERDASFRLHRAETLRNDYREQSKCINQFVDQIQELLSSFHTKVLAPNNNLVRKSQVINENALEVKANLKKSHDKIFDIPISDNPAKPFLQQIEDIYVNIVSEIDDYVLSLKNTCDYILSLEKEDECQELRGDDNLMETPIGLIPLKKTVLIDAFNLIRDRLTDNQIASDSSAFLNGWTYPCNEDREISWKPLTKKSNLFLLSSPILTQAYLSKKDNEMLYDAYRYAVKNVLHRLDSLYCVDANVKNFINSIENYIDKTSFESLLVIPMLITRQADDTTSNAILETDNVYPIEITEDFKEKLLERLSDANNFAWDFSHSNSVPHCRFELDDELREDLCSDTKDGYLFDEEKEEDYVLAEGLQDSLYLDFVFLDLSHPEISLLLSNENFLKELLLAASEIEKIHSEFHHAVKKELSELTTPNFK